MLMNQEDSHLKKSIKHSQSESANENLSTLFLEHYSAGKVYFDHGAFHQSSLEFLRSHSINGKHQKTLYYLAKCHEKLRDFETAKIFYEKLLKINPLFKVSEIDELNSQKIEKRIKVRPILFSKSFSYLCLVGLIPMTVLLNTSLNLIDPNKGSLLSSYFVLSSLGFASFLILEQVFNKFSNEYRINRDKISIVTGVLKKQKRDIWFHQIKNINLSETSLDRLCGNVSIVIETQDKQKVLLRCSKNDEYTRDLWREFVVLVHEKKEELKKHWV